ncbi:DUF1465 family protein [Algihabitans albus]|uniref:DUF1465 family protein n=1 Tax=Algihabitans albus TaxID=2164067 RepID=UPI000E5D8C0F|nr:DUF1465 family protein [Algihabitans albus]
MSQNNPSEVSPQISFLNGTYAEALALTQEARDYVALEERAERKGLRPADQLVAACESMRVTTRLTQVMAWLLVQRAVQAGEMTRDDARQPQHRLSAKEICETSELSAPADLTPRMMHLLSRSHALYERVARLDALLDT